MGEKEECPICGCWLEENKYGYIECATCGYIKPDKSFERNIT